MKKILLATLCLFFAATQAYSQCAGFSASITSSVNDTCLTSGAGQATVTPTGGTTPYSYSWSNADTNATATGLTAGTYFVTVTDSLACTAVDSVTIIVVDTTGPMIMTNNLSINLGPSRFVTIIADSVDNGTTDNCGIDSLWLSDDTFDCSQVGVNNATFYARDENGNVDSMMFTVTIADTNSAAIELTIDTVCGSYIWALNGLTYSMTGVYFDTLQNRFGCDSVYGSLDITILAESAAIDTIVACDSLVWIDGNTYFSDNDSATFVLTNAVGCDSTVTLDLTINNSSASSQSDSACFSYTWAQNNQTYTTSGSYIDVVTNAAGCDSTITLELEIRPFETSVINVGDSLFAFLEGATYQWFDCSTNSNVPGATGRGFRPDTSGFFSVIVDNGLCSDTSACQEVIIIGLQDRDLDKTNFSLFPNPTKDNFTFSVDRTQLDQRMQILSMQGQVIFERRINRTEEIIHIEDWDAGIYFVRYGDVIKKLVITK
jgi:hypothetical protein